MSNNDINLLSLDILNDAAGCLKIMAHPIRLRIVDILMQGEFCVKDISAFCEIKDNQVCEHLRLMQGCGLLKSERRGKSVYYKILSPHLPSLLQCVRLNCSAGQLNG